MRTTLTLDDDVASKLKERSRQSGDSFKQVVNEVLRLGLAFETERRPSKPFRVRARSLELREGLSYDNVAELLERIEEA